MDSIFRQNLQEALRNNQSNSRNLSAFAVDTDHYLMQTGLFTKVKTKKTGDPESALLITCTLAQRALAHGEVAHTLVQVWKDAPLGYGSEQDSYEITHHPDGVRMDFVTVAPYKVVVTGRIEVIGFSV